MTEPLPEQLPHGSLEEVLPGIFVVMGQTRPNFGGQQLEFTRTMTVIRDGSELTLVNTLRLDADALAELETLGTVRHVVKLGSFHGRDDAFYIQRYGAAMWAFSGMPHGRGVKTDHELVPGQAGPTPDSTSFRYESSETPEGHLLLARHGGILLACDSLQNMAGPDEWFDEETGTLMAEKGFFGEANVGPGWRGSANPQAADFERLTALSFCHLISAHGPPRLNSAHEAVSATVARLYGV